MDKVKRLVMTIDVKGFNRKESCDKARQVRLNTNLHLVDDCTITECEEIADLHYRIHIFDFYVVESLGFFQFLDHIFRKVRAAIFSYIGISTPVIVVETNAGLSPVNRAG